MQEDLQFDIWNSLLPLKEIKIMLRHCRCHERGGCKQVGHCQNPKACPPAPSGLRRGGPWNSVARWTELAAEFAKRFNTRMIRGYELVELQADEICTLIGNKRKRL